MLDGWDDGWLLESEDGSPLGDTDGELDGTSEGWLLGFELGVLDGAVESVGWYEGKPLGIREIDGLLDGLCEGRELGCDDGVVLGTSLGVREGKGLG